MIKRICEFITCFCFSCGFAIFSLYVYKLSKESYDILASTSFSLEFLIHTLFFIIMTIFGAGLTILAWRFFLLGFYLLKHGDQI